MKKIAFMAIVFSLILFLPWAVSAQGEQSEYQAEIFNPDLSQFPLIQTNLVVYQPDGGFVHGLDQDSVFMLEDGASLRVDTIQEVRIGMQTSVVINAGPGFANRNSKGISRFDLVKAYLDAWAQDQKEIGIDDLSLFTNNGIQQTHLKNSQAWLTAFATYQPDLKKSVSRIDDLSAAIQTAQDTSFSQPVHRAIFYFTVLPGKEMTEAVMDDLIDRARQADTRVYIWMLASKSDFNSPESGYLRTISEQTGGQFFAFSGSESFPEAKTLLEPLRFIYQVTYRSNVQKGGQHNLAARINLQEQTISSAPAAFTINLVPVNPIFVGVPASIQRTISTKTDNGSEQLVPSDLLVEFLVEYPDRLDRDLSEASLWVDGVQAAVNTSPPFTRFIWDLSSYQVSGRHTLQVKLTDSLGISAVSNTLPVQIDVLIPEPTTWQKIIQGQGVYLVFAGVFLLGLASAYLWLRIRSGNGVASSSRSPVRAGSVKNERALIASEPTGGTGEKPALRAACILINQDLEEIEEPAVQLGKQPVSWGKDREKVSIWIDDDALADLHCSITLNEEGSFVLTDHQTELGTWLNYQQISEGGQVLHMGDIIQIGDLRYRFEVGSNTESGNVVILPYNNH